MHTAVLTITAMNRLRRYALSFGSLTGRATTEDFPEDRRFVPSARLSGAGEAVALGGLIGLGVAVPGEGSRMCRAAAMSG